MNKRGMSEVVTNAFIIMLTIVGLAIIAGVIIPFVQTGLQKGTECINYENYFTFEETTGYNCYQDVSSITGKSYLHGISIKAADDKTLAENVDGFALAFIASNGESSTLTVKNGTSANHFYLAPGIRRTDVDCYGSNLYGQAADYNGGDAVAVSAGAYHTCVLKSNKKVHCYGNNDQGQAADYNGGDAVAVSAGGDHTCILKSNKKVHCYGSNLYEQSADYNEGDAVAVSAGLNHTCVLKSNGNVDCYGYSLRYSTVVNQNADYNGGDAVAVSAGDYHTCVLKSNGNVDCYGDNSMRQAASYNGEDAVAVSAGDYHTCVLKSNGNVDCYGISTQRGYAGQTEDYTIGDAVAVSAGGKHTCVLKSEGNVSCYGSKTDGQSVNYNEGNAVGVSAGGKHTCVLKSTWAAIKMPSAGETRTYVYNDTKPLDSVEVHALLKSGGVCGGKDTIKFTRCVGVPFTG